MLAFTALLSGCSGLAPLPAELPTPELPQLALVENEQPEVESSEVNNSDTLNEAWWLSFQQPQLNEFIQQALHANPSLQAALARLKSSQALFAQAEGDRWPSLDLTAGKRRDFQKGNISTINNAGIETSESRIRAQNSWQLGLTASYDLDLWGGLEAAERQRYFNFVSEQSRSRMQADLVAAQVAQAWLGIVTQRRQQQLLDGQIARVEKSLAVMDGRFRRAQLLISDIWQQQQLLKELQAQRISADAQLSVFHQTLQLWLGQPLALADVIAKLESDQDQTSLAQRLPQMVDVLAQLQMTGSGQRINSEQIAQRADVEAAWAQVAAAHAGVAVARAQRYPRFTLSAGISSQQPDIPALLDDWGANLVASLALPLLDGGSRAAAEDSRRALLQAALADYRQAFLQASDEVHRQLIRVDELSQLRQSLEQRLELAGKTAQYQQSRYFKGVGDYLSLLTAQREQLSLEAQQLNNQSQLLQAQVALMQGLSHGQNQSFDVQQHVNHLPDQGGNNPSGDKENSE